MSEWVGREDAEFAGRLADFIDRRLADLGTRAVSGHGDFWLGNLLVDPQLRHVTGVLDWDRADLFAPPLEDVLSLLCFRKRFLTRWDPGERLAAILRGVYGKRDRTRLRGYILALHLLVYRHHSGAPQSEGQLSFREESHVDPCFLNQTRNRVVVP